jgi:hypothetical protein
MAGNSLGLYISVPWWDHIPHFHGPGALSMVLMGAFGMGAMAAAGLATILHVALECHEFYGDVLLGTHNVNGMWATVNDLACGLGGVLIYTVIFKRFGFTSGGARSRTSVNELALRTSVHDVTTLLVCDWAGRRACREGLRHALSRS